MSTQAETSQAYLQSKLVEDLKAELFKLRKELQALSKEANVQSKAQQLAAADGHKAEQAQLRKELTVPNPSVTDVARSRHSAAMNVNVPVCSQSDLANGQWVFVNRSVDLPTSDSRMNRDRSHGWHDWHVPNGSCFDKLEPLTRDLFCATVAGRSILFVGDSLQHLMANSLWSLISSYSEPFAIKQKTLQGEPIDFLICNHTSSIAFVRNDDLDLFDDSDKSWSRAHGDGIHTHPWKDLLPRYQILVLNVGAHWRSVQRYEALLLSVSSHLLRHYGGNEVYFRTTPMGHTGCSNNSVVLSEISLTQYQPAGKWLSLFHWDLFPAYNEIARIVWGNFSKLFAEKNGYSAVLDVYRMTMLRPDLHLHPPDDCLHYKLPSVVDHWNWLLINTMRRNIAPTG